MNLSDRKRKILQMIIEDYIASAEPISSRTISKTEGIGLSSATIRNEMSDLEELGFLISPHTSAGRIPSDMGYRFYVNELMQQHEMSMGDVVRLRRFFTAGILQLDRLIRQAGDIIAQLTSYTTVTITPEIGSSYIKRFELVPVDNSSALLVLITGEGIVRNQLISVQQDNISLRRLSALLNEKLSGLTLEDINLVKINELQSAIGENQSILMPILSFIHQTISDLGGSEIYVANAQNILNHPEYYDIAKARALLGFLEDKQNVKTAVDTGGNDGITVTIGAENKHDQMREASIVTAKYITGGKTLGRIGILGPTRMDYAKVITALESISSNLDEIVLQIYEEETT